MEPKTVPVNTGSGGELLDFSWLSILQSQLPDQQLPKLPGNKLQLAKIELGSFSTKVGVRIHILASKWILIAPKYPKRHDT